MLLHRLILAIFVQKLQSMRMIFWVCCNFICFLASAQQSDIHTVFFDQGKASISLQQLDSIKQIAAAVQSSDQNKLLVYSYASDAADGASNLRLSRQRAFLMQQCFEREGIALHKMHIENKVRHQSEGAICDACAEIHITIDTNFFNQEIYHKQIAVFMQQYARAEIQSFKVDAALDQQIMTKEGVLLYIPAGTFNATDSVVVNVKYVHDTWGRLMHQLDTRTHRQEFLDMQDNIYVEAWQQGQPIEMNNNKAAVLVMPARDNKSAAMVYQHEGANWFSYPNQKKPVTGTFYGGGYCADSAEVLETPVFPEPPKKPVLIDLKTAVATQNNQLEVIENRLKDYAAMRVDEKGKPIKLNPQLRRKEEALKTKKNRLLVAKEKMLNDCRAQNQLKKDSYHQQLARYNTERNKLQRAYVNKIDSIGLHARQKNARCIQYAENLNYLKTVYPQYIYEQIMATLRNAGFNYELGYWASVSQLGWVSVAMPRPKSSSSLVPFRVQSTASAYKVRSFLIFEDKSIVLGEALDATDIVFWEVPEGQKATLVALYYDQNKFKIACQQVITNGNPPKIDYNYNQLSSLSSKIR